MLESLVPLALFVAIHLFAHRLEFLQTEPRSRWLSLAGGVAVAYVFVHLLPELAAGQHLFFQEDGMTRFGEKGVWMVALLGLVVFYSLERTVLLDQRESFGDAERETRIFHLHLSSFAVYNGLVGFLLLERSEDKELAWYTVAMALHFLVTDFGLRSNHPNLYRREGRWILSAAPVAGWALGLAVEVEPQLVILLTAFLGGGVVLNTMKEELPEERESNLFAFLAGTALYTVVLLL